MNRRDAIKAAVAGVATAMVPSVREPVLQTVYCEGEGDGRSVPAWLEYSDGRRFWTTAPLSKLRPLLGQTESVVMERIWS
jgi:hypothetical protein